MKPWRTIATAVGPHGDRLELRQHDGEYVIAADGFHLMVSSVHRSEQEIVAVAWPNPRARARALVGGLGMGFTLRATLDHVSPLARVVVAEVVGDVVDWNHGPLGAMTGHPLDDARVEVRVDDVANIIRASSSTFDAIFLDLDNGPDPNLRGPNGWLYTRSGLSAASRALRPGGVLAVWSAAQNPTFLRALRAAGFEPSLRHIKDHGTRTFIFVGSKASGSPGAGQAPIASATRAHPASSRTPGNRVRNAGIQRPGPIT